MPVLTMTTKALPLKNRPYMLATKPTAAPPTAAGISFWLGNLVPVKWLHTQPMHETATSKYYEGHEIDDRTRLGNMGLPFPCV